MVGPSADRRRGFSSSSSSAWTRKWIRVSGA